MQLTQMQDIGGCRAVMPTILEVNRLVQVYEDAAKKNPPRKDQPLTRPELVESYDYITNPKSDGYRSYHFVFKYGSEAEKKQAYRGLRIEIQIRSKLQHAWATAVETVSTFTEHALKSGMGDPRWKRFFALMGSVLALRESCPVVPNTPLDEQELKYELRQLYEELQVEALLTGMRAAVDMVGDNQRRSKAYLLVLNASQKTLRIESYDEGELPRASQDYIAVEEENVNNPAVQAVLVSVDSIATLQSAYPNYYLDTEEFLDAVHLALAE